MAHDLQGKINQSILNNQTAGPSTLPDFGPKIFWPKAINKKFLDVAFNTRDDSGQHVECMAYVCGLQDQAGNISAAFLVFPAQWGNSSRVEDLGIFGQNTQIYMSQDLAKTATMTPHPMIDTGNVEQYKTFIKAALGKVAGPEHVELYWYMLEIFTDHDTDKDGIIKQAEFSEMMNQFLATPRKLGLPCPAAVS